MSPDTQFKTKITIGYGQLKPIIEWCTRNCVNDWGYDCLEVGGREGGLYDFYFETESDYINFILWKK
jgi:hypothetical protein